MIDVDADHPLQEMVRRLNLHVAISPDDARVLLGLPVTLRDYPASSYLVREGDVPDRCAVLVSGFAFRHKITSEGARQIVSLRVPGEMLDLPHLFFDVADHNVQTLTRATVATVPPAALRRLAQRHPGIHHAMLVDILVEAAISREWVVNIGRRSARVRLAHLLCEFAVRLGRQGSAAGQDYDLPMSQEQLADAAGLTPVHVNRTLKGLEAEGLITRDRRRLSFPHWQALKNVSDFNDRYLHLRPRPLPGRGTPVGG